MRQLAALTFAVVLVLGLAVVGTAAEAETVSLAQWEGSWNTLDAYLEDDALDDAYKILARRNGGTAADAKANFKKRYKCEIASMKIEDNTLTIYSKVRAFALLESDVLDESAYAFKGEIPTAAGYSWYHFQALDESAKYPVLILLPVGEDEPGVTMRHFHFRYGTDVDALVAMDGWFPTMVKSTSTIVQIANDFTLE